MDLRPSSLVFRGDSHSVIDSHGGPWEVNRLTPKAYRRNHVLSILYNLFFINGGSLPCQGGWVQNKFLNNHFRAYSLA